MNVLRMAATYVVATAIVLSSFVSNAALLTTNPARPNSNYDNLSFDTDFEVKLQDVTGPIDAQLTYEVKKRIRQYLRHKSRTETILARRDLYFPIFDNVITERHLPRELKYLAIVESGLNPNARSGVGAVGLWQLMKGTGKMLGLSINRTLDHRRDPFRSTEAALTYLEKLYKDFGDWTLAIAAYNSGPGRVRKAIRRSGSRNFWKLKRYLPKETRDYVPAFIAVSYILNYYTAHGLEPDAFEDDLRFTSTIKVYDHISFKELSKDINTPVSTIKLLNPAYLKGYIPKYASGNYLVLPAMAMNQYLEQLWAKDSEPKVEIIKVRVAESFKTMRKIAELTPLNTIQSDAVLRLDLSIPPSLVGLLPRRRLSSQPVRYYKLKRRESLLDLAKSRKNVSLENLLEWNNLSLNNPPKPGMIIKIYED